jgi:hypothetical protein
MISLLVLLTCLHHSAGLCKMIISNHYTRGYCPLSCITLPLPSSPKTWSHFLGITLVVCLSEPVCYSFEYFLWNWETKTGMNKIDPSSKGGIQLLETYKYQLPYCKQWQFYYQNVFFFHFKQKIELCIPTFPFFCWLILLSSTAFSATSDKTQCNSFKLLNKGGKWLSAVM